MKTKIFTLFLALAASVGSVLATPDKIDGIYYELDYANKTAIVSYNSSDKYTGSVTIPSTVKKNGITYTVTGIGESAFWGCTGLTSVVMPNSITDIARCAFPNCSKLASVTMSSNVTNIGEQAFYSCSQLKSITIPNGVITIGSQAFYSCNQLSSITIPSSVTSIGSNAFYGTNLRTLVIDGDDNIKFGQNAFSGSAIKSITWKIKNWEKTTEYHPFSGISHRDQITSFTFGSQVTKIPANICEYMTNLQSITIPNSTISIEKEAFIGCSGLKSITIPENVESIEKDAFKKCIGITSVIWNAKKCSTCDFSSCKDTITSVLFGSKVETIPDGICRDMTRLTSIIIPNSVTYIGSNAFNGCSSLQSIIIPEGVGSIDSCAFENCKITSITWNAQNGILNPSGSPFHTSRSKISSFVFGDDVEYIPDYICREISSIEEIQLPEKVKIIGKEAFKGCSSIKSINLPQSIQEIKSYAFASCSSIKSFNFSQSIQEIESYAFASCTSLTDIIFPNDLKYVANGICDGCVNLQTVTLPDSAMWLGEKAFRECEKLISITIPSGVISIGKSAFSGCRSLSSVDLNCQYIHEYAFSGCSGLSSVVIGDRTTSAEAYCFSDCTNLKTVVVGNGLTDLAGVFYNCKSIESLSLGSNITNMNFNQCDSLRVIIWNIKNYPDCNAGATPFSHILSSVSSFTFGDSVKTIPANICNGMKNMEDLSIGNSVTSIGEGAFRECTSLKGVNISDIGAWLNISFKNIFANPTYYAKKLYIDGKLVTKIEIPNDIAQIKDYAFINCTAITEELNIPNNVQYIGKEAFVGCNGITNLIIGNNVDSVGDDAFWGCSRLESVTWNAIACENSDSKKHSADLPLNSTFSNPIFGENNSITVFKFGDKCITIPMELCCDMTKLKYIEIGKNVLDIGYGAFYNCTSLDSVLWNARHYDPESIIIQRSNITSSPRITWYTPFYLTHAYTTTEIRDNVEYEKYIRTNYCYDIASQIKSLTIGTDVKTLPGLLFYNMRNLRVVKSLAVTPPQMELKADQFGNQLGVFYSVPTSKIPLIVPVQSINLYHEADQWKEFCPILALEASEAEVDAENVTAMSTPDAGVILEWPSIEDVVVYTIDIKKDGEVICTFNFDAEGQLLSFAFAMPSKGGNGRKNTAATQTAKGWQYKLEGLETNAEYTYTITAKNNEDITLFTQTITFVTQAPQGIDDINAATKSQKIVRDNQVLILRGDKTYTVTGQEVK